MFAPNIIQNTMLQYHFPSASEVRVPLNLPREVLLSKNLKIEAEQKPKAPLYTNTPISKSFNTNEQEYENPLNDILQESRKLINAYVLAYPETKESEQQPAPNPKKNRSRKSSSKKKIRGTKRTRLQNESSLEEVIQEKQNLPEQDSSACNTPIPNKTIYFSPSGSSKKKHQNLLQSTPVSVLKEATLNLQKSNKVLKIDKATLVTKLQEESQKENFLAEATADDSEYDDLACHADNILRMAVDSTMLGSFNGSISSSFSNTFANDSVLGIKMRKKYPDILDDDIADKSLLELRSSRWNTLDRMKASKIEINAEDLQAAVNE